MAKAKGPSAQRVVEILDRAIELMNDSGAHWTQGAFKRRLDGEAEYAYCSVGAIREASGFDADQTTSDDLTVAAIEAVARATIPYTQKVRADEHRAYAPNIVIHWNDDPDTTWRKVVTRFKRARTRVLKRAEAGLSGF